MQQAQGPKPGMSEKWYVLQFRCIYGPRDEIKGTKTSVEETHFTRAWAQVRASQLNVCYGGDDCMYDVRCKNERGQFVLPPRPTVQVGPNQVSLPF